MRIGKGTKVHLGYLSSITGPAGEPRYCSWCPASKRCDGTVEAGEAIAEAIDCGSCRRQADAEALERAAAAAAVEAAALAHERAATVDLPEWDMDLIVAELGKLGVSAYLERTGGGTATIYAGESVYDFSERCHRHPVAAGPGYFEGPGWTRGRAWRDEFSIGITDQDLCEPFYPPEAATEAQVALMIANVVQGTQPLDSTGRVLPYESKPVEKPTPLADPIAALYQAVVTDHSVDWLDRLMIRAGLIWCHEHTPAAPHCVGFMNRVDEDTCGGCGTPRKAGPTDDDAADDADTTLTNMLAILTEMWVGEGRPAHPFTPFTPHGRDRLEGRCRLCGLTRDEAPEHA